MNRPLEIKTEIQIRKPAHEIFEAIVDPAKMSNYFISYSSGSMEEDKKILWQFPEYDMVVPVRVFRIVKDKYISYYWDFEGKDLLVEIALTPQDKNSTVVTVTEKSMPMDLTGLKWLKKKY